MGRHALLFDDDPMAAFVNSADALVEWHSLQIDRYDVRHLLSSPPPPRRRIRNFESKSSDEILMDQERYLDLPPDSDQPGICIKFCLFVCFFFPLSLHLFRPVILNV